VPRAAARRPARRREPECRRHLSHGAPDRGASVHLREPERGARKTLTCRCRRRRNPPRRRLGRLVPGAQVVAAGLVRAATTGSGRTKKAHAARNAAAGRAEGVDATRAIPRRLPAAGWQRLRARGECGKPGCVRHGKERRSANTATGAIGRARGTCGKPAVRAVPPPSTRGLSASRERNAFQRRWQRLCQGGRHQRAAQAALAFSALTSFSLPVFTSKMNPRTRMLFGIRGCDHTVWICWRTFSSTSPNV